MSLFDPRDARPAALAGAVLLAYGLFGHWLYRQVRDDTRIWRKSPIRYRRLEFVRWYQWGAWWTLGVACLLLLYALVTVVVAAVT